MQIILQEDIEKLGTRGEVVNVAEGYARNYLLPRKLALEASPGNLKRLEKIRTTLAKRTATEREGAQKQAELLQNVTLSFSRKAGENDQYSVRLRPGISKRRSRRKGLRLTSGASSSPSPSRWWANTKSPQSWYMASRRRSKSTFPGRHKTAAASNIWQHVAARRQSIRAHSQFFHANSAACVFPFFPHLKNIPHGQYSRFC